MLISEEGAGDGEAGEADRERGSEQVQVRVGKGADGEADGGEGERGAQVERAGGGSGLGGGERADECSEEV